MIKKFWIIVDKIILKIYVLIWIFFLKNVDIYVDKIFVTFSSNLSKVLHNTMSTRSMFES